MSNVTEREREIGIVEAMRILNMSRSGLHHWHKLGRLVPIRNDGPGRNRGRRYRLSDIKAMRDSFQKLV